MIDNNEMPNGSSMAAVAPVLSARVQELRLAGRLDGDKGSSGSTAWLPWILCVLMAVAWASVGMRYYRANPAGGSATAAVPGAPVPAAPGDKSIPKRDPANVPAAKPDEPVLEAKGYVIPAHQISVSPIEVSGRVIRLEIEEGMKFKKDDILAVIEDVGFRSDFEEAKAQLASFQEKYNELLNGSRPEEIDQARSDLAEAEANLKQYRNEWERYQGKTFDALARRDFDQVESAYRGGDARVSRLKQSLKLMVDGPRKERIIGADADVKAAAARLKRAEWKLANCTIRSPVDGVILTKKAEIGSLLNPVVGGVSTSLCEIADLSDLEIDMEIQERDIAKIFDGQYCRVKPDAFSERIYEAYVDRAMPIANRARGIIPIRVKVLLPATEKQGQFLKPEMGVSVTFFARKSEKWPGPTGSPAPAPAVKPEPPKEADKNVTPR